MTLEDAESESVTEDDGLNVGVHDMDWLTETDAEREAEVESVMSFDSDNDELMDGEVVLDKVLEIDSDKDTCIDNELDTEVEGLRVNESLSENVDVGISVSVADNSADSDALFD